jgi:hypothetical protein
MRGRYMKLGIGVIAMHEGPSLKTLLYAAKLTYHLDCAQ